MRIFSLLSDVVALGLIVGSTLSATDASAATVIVDNFTDAPAFSSTPLVGTTPNTNLPGGTWAVAGEIAGESAANLFPVAKTGTATPVSSAYLNANTLATISLAGYNSGSLTISAYVSPDGFSALGFASSTSNSAFSGVYLRNNGDVGLVTNGSYGSAVAFTPGTFDSSTASLLSFTVDTATGGITAISLQGSTA